MMNWENIPAYITCGRAQMPPRLLALTAGAINRLHERCLQISYNDKRSSFEDPHYNNLCAPAREMFKVYTKTSPEIMQESFPIKEPGQNNLRNETDFVIPHVNYMYLYHMIGFSSKILKFFSFSKSAIYKIAYGGPNLDKIAVLRIHLKVS